MGRFRNRNTEHQDGPSVPPGTVWIDDLVHDLDGLPVLDGISLEVGAQEVIGLVGPSGCGKSTLLELIAGLQDPSSGEISVGGANSARDRLRSCAYMPQKDELMPWMSAIDNAGIALRNQGASRKAARVEAAPLFERFGLEGFESARPHELSGGMAQRVAFLRTLLSGKPVLLLDEPFAALDAITRGEMQGWLADALEAEPRTVILVSHDVEEALFLCDRVLILSDRPTGIVREVSAPSPRDMPREETVTAPGFALMRERAMVELRGASRPQPPPADDTYEELFGSEARTEVDAYALPEAEDPGEGPDDLDSYDEIEEAEHR